jgi:MoxR-like ATPase
MLDAAACAKDFDLVLDQLDQVILGKRDELRLALCCLLARGHLLIEDLPGVGKTTLAHALARLLGLADRRVQCTADMLPADIIGANIYNRQEERFVFHSGPVFTQVLLADELNRASPKTQSALLEAMEERRVTVEGRTDELPEPFFVIATQNPLEQAGTFPLPESQLDRFLMRLCLGLPARAAERDLLRQPERRQLIGTLQPVLSVEELLALQAAVPRVQVHERVLEYLLDLLQVSRDLAPPGLSPRAGMGLQQAARAWCLFSGRNAVEPDDVQAVAKSVMQHRLRYHRDPDAATTAVLQAVPVP